jgi:hypothetical protein
MGVTFNYSPHKAQVQIHKARGARFRTVCTGRRFGKTLCLAAELLDRGGCSHGGDYGWVAPTYNVAERGIEAFRTIAEGFVNVCGRAPSRVEFTGTAGPVRVWFLSADNPDNIRGFGFQGLVIDEAASIPQDVWHYVLRPTIAQTLGWAVFVSTPKGRNWFYDLFTRGMDPGEKDYASFSFPSKASPYFPEKEWDEARRTLPEDVFRQEYQAEFLEDSAGVFRNVDACLIADCRLPIVDCGKDEGGTTDGHGSTRMGAPFDPGCVRHCVVGCDVAKHTDWTVLIAMDAETGRCFAMERFNQLDWPIQKERIVSFARKYRGRVILDATGVGDPILDDLKRVLPDIEGFKLTSGSKVELVQRLIVAVEQRRVSWPGGWRQGSGVGVQAKSGERAPRRNEGHEGGGERDDQASSGNYAGASWDVLTNEMKRYEYVISPSGGMSYGAPSGYHDDCVIALALANHRRWETENVGRMLPVGAPGARRRRVSCRGRKRVVVA